MKKLILWILSALLLSSCVLAINENVEVIIIPTENFIKDTFLRDALIGMDIVLFLVVLSIAIYLKYTKFSPLTPIPNTPVRYLSDNTNSLKKEIKTIHNINKDYYY